MNNQTNNRITLRAKSDPSVWTHDRDDDGRDLCVDCAYPTPAVTR